MSTLRTRISGGRREAMELAGLIEEQIAAGALRPGDRVLSERRLSELYNMPLHTVRLALRHLKRTGVLISRPKSGVYVASRAPSPGLSAVRPVVDRPAVSSGEGFDLLDVSAPVKLKLHFVIAGWNAANRGMWEQACRGYSLREAKVEVVPHFPRSHEEYIGWRAVSDVFVSTPTELIRPNQPLETVPLELSVLESAGIAKRYIDAVRTPRGDAMGVPLNATLLTGFLNTKLLPPAALRQIETAPSLSKVLEHLAELTQGADTWRPINFSPVRTFNVMQLLFAEAGGLVDERGGRMDLTRPAVRRALSAADQFLDRCGRGSAHTRGDHGDRYSVQIEYTCRAGESFAASSTWKPWAYPLGPAGRYLEGVNIGLVNQRSLHPTQARQFLLYLASPSVQEMLLSVAQEHPVSQHIAEPFKAYSPEYRQVLHTIHERAAVYHEFAPGFVRVVEEVFNPAVAAWFEGRVVTADLCDTVELQGNAYLSEARGREPDRRRSKT